MNLTISVMDSLMSAGKLLITRIKNKVRKTAKPKDAPLHHGLHDQYLLLEFAEEGSEVGLSL